MLPDRKRFDVTFGHNKSKTLPVSSSDQWRWCFYIRHVRLFTWNFARRSFCSIEPRNNNYCVRSRCKMSTSKNAVYKSCCTKSFSADWGIFSWKKSFKSSLKLKLSHLSRAANGRLKRITVMLKPTWVLCACFIRPIKKQTPVFTGSSMILRIVLNSVDSENLQFSQLLLGIASCDV